MNGFSVKLKSLKEINVKAYGNVLSCINIYIYIYIFILNYICMHVLRHYGSLKMGKECINV